MGDFKRESFPHADGRRSARSGTSTKAGIFALDWLTCRLSTTPLTRSVLEQAHTVDFAVIIATPDDLVVKNVKSGKSPKTTMSARDNVFLEYGLFAGALDRQRVFILQKAKVDLASDLQGLTCLRYDTDSELDAKVAEIAQRADMLGPIKRLVRRKDT